MAVAGDPGSVHFAWYASFVAAAVLVNDGLRGAKAGLRPGNEHGPEQVLKNSQPAPAQG